MNETECSNASGESTRDWPEDAAHENGRYRCSCVICKQSFVGHKRRVICRACHVARAEEVIRREGILMDANLLPDRWVLMTVEELVKERAAYANLHLELMVERNLRRDLAEALQRILTAAANSTPVPGLHYALKDAAEIVVESASLDAELAAKRTA